MFDDVKTVLHHEGYNCWYILYDTYSLSCSGRIVPGGHGKAMIPFGGGWIGANPWRTPFKLRSFMLFSWAPSTITTCIWKTNKQWMQGKSVHVCVVYSREGSTSQKHWAPKVMMSSLIPLITIFVLHRTLRGVVLREHHMSNLQGKWRRVWKIGQFKNLG